MCLVHHLSPLIWAVHHVSPRMWATYHHLYGPSPSNCRWRRLRAAPPSATTTYIQHVYARPIYVQHVYRSFTACLRSTRRYASRGRRLLAAPPSAYMGLVQHVSPHIWAVQHVSPHIWATYHHIDGPSPRIWASFNTYIGLACTYIGRIPMQYDAPKITHSIHGAHVAFAR